eukprot:CCRYP_015156-RA/>CCRYP_015156-RA protein AED:0.46 eAED:0.46 QI:0/-1/0/1/-1/0/1/0/34
MNPGHQFSYWVYLVIKLVLTEQELLEKHCDIILP